MTGDGAGNGAATRRRKGPPPRHVLLTGYPGFIGKRMARRILLDWPRAKLTLLVQEKFKSDAEQYVAAMGEPSARRTTIAVGDVAKMDLGLAGPEIEALTHDVTHVFHLAAVQYLGVTAEDAEAVNVGGTRNMLACAREMKKLERFVHFSTCFVSGDREGVITEDELDVGQRFRNHYEETKFRAEKLVRQATSDLPITVLRPSIVVGHSETGEIDRFDGIYAMGILVVTSPMSVPLPLPGPGTAPLNLVPVDFVVRAAAKLAVDERAAGRTFHLVDPNPLSARHVYELIAKRAGKRVPRVTLSYSLARRVLRLPILERFSREEAQALDYLNHFAVYNCSGTLEFLEGTGIQCPRFDAYVDNLMKFVTETLRKDRKARRARPAAADPLDA